MQLNPFPVSTDRFTGNAMHRMLVTEHSDLGRVSLQNLLYDDACDVGIVLYNPNSGVYTRWYLHEEKRDNEGDLTVTVFKPCPETLHAQPQLKGWEVHVLND